MKAKRKILASLSRVQLVFAAATQDAIDSLKYFTLGIMASQLAPHSGHDNFALYLRLTDYLQCLLDVAVGEPVDRMPQNVISKSPRKALNHQSSDHIARSAADGRDPGHQCV